MKIVTWNVNSIRARHDNVTRWLKAHNPDVVLLQELKCTEDKVPYNEYEELGYNMAVFGQQAYNGVSVFSKLPIGDVHKGINHFDDDQARYIEAEINGIIFISVYVPNGQDVTSDKFEYKLKFYDKLHARLKSLIEQNVPFVIGGDFNVALREEDVYDPKSYEGRVSFTTIERQKLNAILGLGLTDAQYDSGHKNYTWWDYRTRGFETGKGMRIDYIFTSPNLSHLQKETRVDIMERGQEKASDHAPVECDLTI